MQFSKKILIIDDEDLLRFLFKNLIEDAGYQTICASDGQEAVEIFKKQHDEIGFVVSDIRMPRMGGKECVEQIKHINPTVPVLVSSCSDIDSPEVLEIFTLDIDGFLQKPFHKEKLVQTIESIMENKDANMG